MCPFECSGEGFWTVQICFGDFVGEVAMLAWIAGQRAHLELAAGLEGAYHPSSLLSRCADDGNQFLIVGYHVYSLSLLNGERVTAASMPHSIFFSLQPF